MKLKNGQSEQDTLILPGNVGLNILHPGEFMNPTLSNLDITSLKTIEYI